MNKFQKLTYWCLGLGATSPLLALVIGGRILSLMTFSLLFTFVDLIISQHNNTFTWIKGSLYFRYYLLWTLFAVISSLFGFVYFVISNEEQFSIRSISYIPKILTYLILVFLFGINSKGKEKADFVISGIKFGVLLNMIWCIIDASMFYTIGESLTNNLFKSYIIATERPHEMASIIDGVSIRSAGLNIEPATIGFFTIAFTAYSFMIKRKWFIILAVLTSMACVSFVGLVGIIIVIFYHTFFWGSVKTKFINISIVLVLLIAGLVFISLSDNLFVVGVRTAVENRAESKSENDISTATRKLFIEKFPNAVANMPTSFLIGTGYDSAAYPYYSEGLRYNHDIHTPASIENTYLDSFFALGAWGVMFFILLYIRIFRVVKRNLKLYESDFNKVVYSVSLGSIVSFAFYHYTIYSVIMLITVFSILYLHDYNVQKVKNGSNNI